MARRVSIMPPAVRDDPRHSHYLWDNWLCWYRRTGLLHRFSLAAPRALTSDERHDHAAIHQWTSPTGEVWEYRGVALERGPPGSFDDQATWSGCAVDLGDRLGLFYTGLAAGASRRQTIAAAFSEDGLRFEKLAEPVLAPDAGELGYDLGAGAAAVGAWRDPFVFQDPGSGDWHMVFSARRRRPGPGRDRPGGALGHALATDPDLRTWRLLPPLALPASYLEMECAAILHHGDLVYCFASTKDRAVDSASAARIALRAWRAPTLGGPWQAAGRSGRDIVFDHRRQIYAASFVRLPGPEERVLVTGFFAEGHRAPYTWAPLVPLAWDGDVPRVDPDRGRSSRWRYQVK